MKFKINRSRNKNRFVKKYSIFGEELESNGTSFGKSNYFNRNLNSYLDWCSSNNLWPNQHTTKIDLWVRNLENLRKATKEIYLFRSRFKYFFWKIEGFTPKNNQYSGSLNNHKEALHHNFIKTPKNTLNLIFIE